MHLRALRTCWVALLFLAVSAQAYPQSPASAQNSAAPTPVTWVIFIDDLHLDFRNTGRIRDALKMITAELIGDSDQFAVASSGPSAIAVDLTADRQSLNDAIRKTTGNALRFTDVIEPGGPAEANYRASIALTTALSIVDSPSLPAGAKALLYISNGYDFEILPDADPMKLPRGQRTSTRAEVRAQMTELRTAAARSSFRIFAIDLRVATPGADLDAVKPAWPAHQDAQRATLQSLSESGFAIVEGSLEMQLLRIAEIMRQ